MRSINRQRGSKIILGCIVRPYSDLHNRLHNNFAEILENLFTFVCSVTRLSEISCFKPFRLSDLCSGSRLGVRDGFPTQDKPDDMHKRPSGSVRPRERRHAPLNAARMRARSTRVSGAMMRKSQRGASPGSACAWSCSNARVKHLGESWARGMGGCSGGRTLAVTDRRAQAAQARRLSV